MIGDVMLGGPDVNASRKFSFLKMYRYPKVSNKIRNVEAFQN
jgi:hypothetical protein